MKLCHNSHDSLCFADLVLRSPHTFDISTNDYHRIADAHLDFLTDEFEDLAEEIDEDFDISYAVLLKCTGCVVCRGAE